MRPAALFDMNAAFIRHGELHNPSSVIRLSAGVPIPLISVFLACRKRPNCAC
jgi:hypothetical protein